MNDFNKMLLGIYLAAGAVEQSKKPPMTKEMKRFYVMIEIIIGITILCVASLYWK